jgi:hypothetical protein
MYTDINFFFKTISILSFQMVVALQPPFETVVGGYRQFKGLITTVPPPRVL